MIETIIGSQFIQKVIPLINEAKSTIDIIVFDWRWYSNDPASSVQLFNQSIIRACRRGVRVRGVVNSNDIKNTLNAQGCQFKKLETKTLLHSKFMLIDEKTAVIGSHNYTQPAFAMNFEFSVILTDFENTNEFINYFKNMYD